MQRRTYTINAADKILGRLASEIALLLRGKDNPAFMPNKDEGAIVIVQNVKDLKVTGKKMEQKKYYRHSGYLGGLKATPMKNIFKTKPEKILKTAVFGMLPKNKLRAKMIKRLKFEK